MTITDILIQQLSDIFRIGLLVALVFTMRNTRAQTGVLIPALAGIVFVAAIIPMTLGRGAEAAGGFWRLFLVGLLSNAVILGVILALWTAVERWRAKGR